MAIHTDLEYPHEHVNGALVIYIDPESQREDKQWVFWRARAAVNIIFSNMVMCYLNVNGNQKFKKIEKTFMSKRPLFLGSKARHQKQIPSESMSFGMTSCWHCAGHILWQVCLSQYTTYSIVFQLNMNVPDRMLKPFPLSVPRAS